MSLYVNMVVRNEAHRYLDSCLAWVAPHVDGIFVYDDQSDDETCEVARKHGAVAVVRDDSVPSFLEEEGSFREAGWKLLIESLNVQPHDWIVGLDADEFPVPIENLRRAVTKAGSLKYGSINVGIPEIFSIDPFSQRSDGFWGKINGTRLVRYRLGDQSFRQKTMGCGVFPAYAYFCQNWNEKRSPLKFLHLGYADERDRQEKYERYTNQLHNGHADAHIQSIMTPGRLKPWTQDIPEVWRGVR